MFAFLSLCLYAVCSVTVQKYLNCQIELDYDFFVVVVGFIIPYTTYINFLEFVLRLSWKQHIDCVRRKKFPSLLRFVIVCVQLYTGGYYGVHLLFSTLTLSIKTYQCLANPMCSKFLSLRCVITISSDLVSCLPSTFLFLLLIQCGDIELNPGPKTQPKRHRNARKGKVQQFIDECNDFLHLNNNELATKYSVSVTTIKRWVKTYTPLRDNLFFRNPALLNESNESLSEECGVHIRTVRRWKQDYHRSIFVYSVDVDNDDNADLAKKYGVREPTISKWKKDADSQWSDWHEQCDDLDGGNDHHDSGFKDMCRPFVYVVNVE